MSDIVHLKTPGVYATEVDAFPPSVVGVQTAVPAFIGYTEKAESGGKSIYFEPVQITSLAEFETIFGKGFKSTFELAVLDGTPAPGAYDFEVAGKFFTITQTAPSSFNLYNSLRLFYLNGGGTCFIVSVGDYTNQGATPGGVGVELAKLENGLTAIREVVGPTMLVIPDAMLLPDNDSFSTLARQMLQQCGTLQDRVAIFDVYGTQRLDQTSTTFQKDLDELTVQFRADVGDENLSYGAAYFPFLNTTVVQPSEINYTNFNIGTKVNPNHEQVTLLQDQVYRAQARQLYSGRRLTQVEEYIDAIDPTVTDPSDTVAVRNLNLSLSTALPIVQETSNIIAGKINVLPPSGAVAGIYTSNDRTIGVWNAPANVALNSVISPTIPLTDSQQGDLNVPIDGKAIDAIRSFVGRGTNIWGARTLDGNSNDYRYIQVRRTLIYLEQSIKAALNQFVFAANDGNTWVTVVSTVSSFLQGFWAQGGLMSATASEAFSVQCGLGSTMTPEDILQGYMIVQVTLQMIRPAEFIKLTFKQKMEGLG
jgi:phage tail sheath protein FI